MFIIYIGSTFICPVKVNFLDDKQTIMKSVHRIEIIWKLWFFTKQISIFLYKTVPWDVIWFCDD